jgi:hypothetical protein
VCPDCCPVFQQGQHNTRSNPPHHPIFQHIIDLDTAALMVHGIFQDATVKKADLERSILVLDAFK